MKSYASPNGYGDRTVLGMHSSLLIVNMNANHCEIGEEDTLMVVAMNALL